MKYANNSLLDKFLNKEGLGDSNHTDNLHIRTYHTDKEGNHTLKLVNYETVIARWDGDVVLVSSRRYSNTTSKHQNYIRRSGAIVVEVDHKELN